VWQQCVDNCHCCQFSCSRESCHERTNRHHDKLEDQHNESTYALLIRSEEKSRNIIEIAICPILILGAVIAIWQFAQQPVNIPAAGLKGADCVACVDDLRAVRQVRHPEVKG
jgi:hypothetical protein